MITVSYSDNINALARSMTQMTQKYNRHKPVLIHATSTVIFWRWGRGIHGSRPSTGWVGLGWVGSNSKISKKIVHSTTVRSRLLEQTKWKQSRWDEYPQETMADLFTLCRIFVLILTWIQNSNRDFERICAQLQNCLRIGLGWIGSVGYQVGSSGVKKFGPAYNSALVAMLNLMNWNCRLSWSRYPLYWTAWWKPTWGLRFSIHKALRAWLGSRRRSIRGYSHLIARRQSNTGHLASGHADPPHTATNLTFIMVAAPPRLDADRWNDAAPDNL